MMNIQMITIIKKNHFKEKLRYLILIKKNKNLISYLKKIINLNNLLMNMNQKPCKVYVNYLVE
jgi:hypothetical protein